MNRLIDTHSHAVMVGAQPAPRSDHRKPLAMPESPIPDWSARHRTPDPLADTPEDRAEAA